MIISRSGLELSDLWHRAAQLIEADREIRDLERRAASGDQEAWQRYVRVLLRTGQLDELDRALPETSTNEYNVTFLHPERQRIVRDLLASKLYDAAEHIEAKPHARRFQRALRAANRASDLMQSSTGEHAREAELAMNRAHNEASNARNDLIASAHQHFYRAGTVSSPIRGVISHAASYLSPELAPDPSGHENSGYGLVGDIAYLADGRRETPDDRESEFRMSPRPNVFRFNNYHNGDDDHWNADHIDGFKDALRAHNLGNVSDHQVHPRAVYPYENDEGHTDNVVDAQHIVHVSPKTNEIKPHAEPRNVSSNETPSDYVARAGLVPYTIGNYGPYYA